MKNLPVIALFSHSANHQTTNVKCRQVLCDKPQDGWRVSHQGPGDFANSMLRIFLDFDPRACRASSLFVAFLVLVVLELDLVWVVKVPDAPGTAVGKPEGWARPGARGFVGTMSVGPKIFLPKLAITYR